MFESIANKAIIDTGTSYIRIPSNDFANLKSALEQRPDGTLRSCIEENGILRCDCGITESTKEFPQITL